jgi:hypothetical protein
MPPAAEHRIPSTVAGMPTHKCISMPLSFYPLEVGSFRYGYQAFARILLCTARCAGGGPPDLEACPIPPGEDQANRATVGKLAQYNMVATSCAVAHVGTCVDTGAFLLMRLTGRLAGKYNLGGGGCNGQATPHVSLAVTPGTNGLLEATHQGPG